KENQKFIFLILYRHTTAGESLENGFLELGAQSPHFDRSMGEANGRTKMENKKIRNRMWEETIGGKQGGPRRDIRRGPRHSAAAPTQPVGCCLGQPHLVTTNH
ncbi:MAG: hypothetical protein WCL32_15345, partial [Planctomycetota bacterium]